MFYYRRKDMKRKMLTKRIAAGIAAIMTAATLCACDDLDEYDEYDDYDDYSDSDTEVKTDDESSDDTSGSETESERSSSDFNGRGSRLKLDSIGDISITRLARDNDVPMGEEGTWTVFVYMCGSDLESENGLGVGDIEEMAEAYTDENVRFVVQTGGSSQWNGYDISADSIQRLEITGGEVYLADETADANMGDEETLADFLRWGVANYPADKMGVVLWNHGGGNNKSEGYTNMVDLGELFRAACDESDAQAVLDALNEAVIYNRYGEEEENSNGLATYYPLSIEGSQELEIFKDICVSPQYMSFVDRMAYGSANGSTEGYSNDMWLDESNGYWDDESWEDYDFWSFLDDISGSDSLSFAGDSISYAVEPYLSDDGTFTFTLDESSMDYVSGIYCSVFCVDDEQGYLYELGLDNYVNVDWQNGTAEDSFDGLWYVLGDGQVLAAYIAEEGVDYDIYTAPILLNGEQTNLRIKMQYHDDGYDNFILGTWDGIDEYGQAAKTVRKLSSGDVITPVYYTYDENGEYVGDTIGNDYVYDGDINIYDEFLPSADYLYSFCIEDIYGNSSYTDFVTFNVDDNGDVSFYID